VHLLPHHPYHASKQPYEAKLYELFMAYKTPRDLPPSSVRKSGFFLAASHRHFFPFSGLIAVMLTPPRTALDPTSSKCRKMTGVRCLGLTNMRFVYCCVCSTWDRGLTVTKPYKGPPGTLFFGLCLRANQLYCHSTEPFLAHPFPFFSLEWGKKPSSFPGSSIIKKRRGKGCKLNGIRRGLSRPLARGCMRPYAGLRLSLDVSVVSRRFLVASP